MATAAALAAKYEGYVPRVYKDPIGVLTACYGHTGPELKLGKTYTQAECLQLLTEDIYEAMQGVEQCVRAPVTNNQKVAILDLFYNIGPTKGCGSALIRKLNAGAPKEEWCPEFKKWVYAAGIKLPGLVKRRDEEYQFCMTPDKE